MIFPSMSVLSFSAILMVALLAADWYVWGMTYSNRFRQPMKPCGETLEVNTSAHEDGHGFRKVA
jgi:hypothetical protein